MKKSNIYHILILVLIFVSCKNEDKQIIDEYINSEGQNVIEYKLNDSIIERVMKKNDKLEARELENTKNDSIEILYYDKFEKLFQSIKFNTKNPNSLVENNIHYSDGKVAERVIKNQNGEKLAEYRYNYFDKLEKEYYYREGQLNINSFATYKSNGKVDLRERKTRYLKITEKNDSILIDLIGYNKNKFRIIKFLIYDNYPKNHERKMRLLFERVKEDVESISIAKTDIVKFKNNLNCVVQFINLDNQGLMNIIEQELYIESLDKIPSNNLYFIRKK